MDAFAVGLALLVVALVTLATRSGRVTRVDDGGPGADSAVTAAIDETFAHQTRLRGYP